MDNLDCFSHGQVASKIWLCEQLEPYINDSTNVMILGSWVNVIGFMLLTRNPKKYNHIRGIDSNPTAIELADKVNSYWFIEGILRNTVDDANTVNKEGYHVVINCSSEHMRDTEWFDNIHPGTLVCIQSSNITDTNDPWYITNPSPTYESFMAKYPLNVKFAGTLPITYSNWGYERYMVIGIK